MKQILCAWRVAFYVLIALSSLHANAQVVISQVYGGGGNSGATYKNDFIELFNRGTTPVDLNGWSVQYASVTGNSWQRTILSGTIPPGGYFLIQELNGAGGTIDLTTADVFGTINLSAMSGKVALANQTILFTTSCPIGSTLIDFVGYGNTTGNTANCYEGNKPAPTLNNTAAALRVASGCTDNNSNDADFATGAPNPRNSSTTRNPCSSPVITVTPTSLTLLNSTQQPGGNAVTYTVSATGLTTSDFRVTAPAPFLLSAPNTQPTSGGILLPVNSDGTLSPTVVTVALVSSSPGTFAGVVSNVSGSTTATVPVSGTTLSPTLTVNPTTLNGFSTTVGAPSAIQTYTITAAGQTGGFATAPTGVEIRTGTNAFSSSLTIPGSLSTTTIPVDVRLTGATAGPVTGSITHRLATSSNQSIANVAVSGTVMPPAEPKITVTPTSLTLLNSTQQPGGNSTSYTVSATGLTTSDFRVTAPAPFIISAPNALPYPGGILLPVNSDGTLSPTVVTVALVSSSPGTFTGIIANTTNLTTVNVPVSGTTVSPRLSVTPTSLTNFSTTVGTPSAIQTYTLTASGQTGGFIAASAGVQIRTGSNAFAYTIGIPGNLGTLTIPIDVRLTGDNAGSVSGPILHQLFTSSNQSVAEVAVSGVVSPKGAAASLVVLHRDADYGNTQNAIIQPFLELSNTGSEAIPYNELTVRYWFTSEGNAPPTNLAVYYAPLGAVQMRYVALSQPRQGAYGYVEYSFPNGGSLPAGSNSGPIENGIQKTDGSPFNELDDYSYMATYANYTPNNRITAYRNGTLLWGQEPAEVAAQSIIRVYSAAKDSPVTSQIQTRIEVRNEGNTSVNASDLTVRYYFTSDNGQLANVYVDYAAIGTQNMQAKVVRNAVSAMADSYVELTFVGSTQQLAPQSSSGPIDIRIVRSDYGLLDQTNDYSYAPNYGNVGLNSRITAYLSGSLVFGTTPAGMTMRAAAQEVTTPFRARVLGNPIVGDRAHVEISGAQGQAVVLTVVDLQGKPIYKQRIEQADAVEQVQVPLGMYRGLFVLDVRTANQQQQVKLVRL